MTTVNHVDPVTVQVIGNALLSIADEVGAVLRQASYSTNIKERSDCSTAVFNKNGRLIAQAEHIPIHMGSMKGAIDELLRTRGASALVPGEVFITNDPYAGGGTHLPDITMVAPVFRGEELIGFSANIAHHSDVGGHVAGSNSGDSTSIFQEGLRIPLVRFATQEGVLEDILAFVTLNSRLPEERRGDLLAQSSAVGIGAKRLVELTDKYGIETMQRAQDELLEYGQRRLAAAVDALPDGEYSYSDWLDSDVPGEDPIPVAVTIRVIGDQIELDFDGTGREAKVAINVVRSALEATVYYSLKAGLDPEIPANGGFFDSIKISAPLGSLVNPKEPAPVAARTDACQRVADVIMGALAQAIPDRIPAGSHSSITYVTFAGGKDDFFVYPEVIAGGFGARPTKDGLDAVQVHVTNSSNLPIEALELEYPLMVDSYELIQDSGGAGEFRGGLAVRRDIRIMGEEAEFSAHADRQTYPPRGFEGGLNGSPGRFILRPGTPEEETLNNGRVSGIKLYRGDVLRIESPGSGGFGPPEKRDPKKIEADLRERRVSMQAAERDYRTGANSSVSEQKPSQSTVSAPKRTKRPDQVTS
ncbi:hydantoinase B/oxoprolinase family protein [Pseudarthrobacter phenanthrenivorans]|uniref:hydantoinase B/oxoprolinase family protein n=1 Tax=Pseudarthrobacter phenanthrenivorans TaxID=361575 RepID=UPI001C6400BF|nr:hydantoinase B/oxoprolinase family protein [Pseudarthrobacter phenanthrenivorans]